MTNFIFYLVDKDEEDDEENERNGKTENEDDAQFYSQWFHIMFHTFARIIKKIYEALCFICCATCVCACMCICMCDRCVVPCTVYCGVWCWIKARRNLANVFIFEMVSMLFNIASIFIISRGRGTSPNSPTISPHLSLPRIIILCNIKQEATVLSISSKYIRQLETQEPLKTKSSHAGSKACFLCDFIGP